MADLPYIMENGVMKPMASGPKVDAGPVWKEGRPTVIQAIGDSLTRGQGGETTGGYRGPLWEKLKTAGKSIETVGFQKSPGPGRWSGDGGWRCDDLAHAGTRNQSGMAFVDWLRAYKSDIALVHIGTNDIGSPMIPIDELMNRLSVMLDEAYPFSPQTHIFVATPLVNLDPPWATTKSFSIALEEMIQGKIDAGRPYHIVPGMDTIAGKVNYWDPIHLNVAGYELMAQKWADVLLALD